MKPCKQGKIIVYNVAVLTGQMNVLHGQTVECEEGLIRSVRKYERGEEQRYTEAEHKRSENTVLIDGSGKLMMPGLCDSHMHTGQQLLKGKVLDELPMIWTRIMLPFESTITPEIMELSASLAALEMIKSGTTTFVDAGSYHMESAAHVYEKSGLRAVLSASTMDDPSLPESIRQTAKEAVAQTDILYEKYNGKGNLQIAYSLRSLISCSEELIALTARHAKERGALLQAHMNEYPNEVNFFLKKYQVRPFVYLDRLGVLDDRFIGAHALLLSEEEKDRIQERDVKLCHCPFSNCGKGVPDTPSLLDRGICVGLGTDGAAHGGLSIWNEMKIFRSVMNVAKGVPLGDPAIMPAGTVLEMASKYGHRLAGVNSGEIKAGSNADFITIRIDAPHLFPTGNIVNTLLECVTAADVCDSVVGGEVLMRDRQVLTLDEDEIMKKARTYCEKEVKERAAAGI